MLAQQQGGCLYRITRQHGGGLETAPTPCGDGDSSCSGGAAVPGLPVPASWKKTQQMRGRLRRSGRGCSRPSCSGRWNACDDCLLAALAARCRRAAASAFTMAATQAAAYPPMTAVGGCSICGAAPAASAWQILMDVGAASGMRNRIW